MSRLFENYTIIDAHAHIWPDKLAQKATDFLENYYGIPMEGVGRLPDILDSMDIAGVDKCVALSVATKPEQVTNINDFIAGLQENLRIIGFGALHVEHPNCSQEINRIKELGLKGIKLHPDFQNFKIDDINMMRLYEKIGDRLPILIHLGDEKTINSTPERLANVLDQLPYLRIIATHMGGYSCWDEAERHIVGRDVCIETSSSLSFLPKEAAVRMIRAHGADKILFGTDFPVARHETELERIAALGLTDEEYRGILGENLLRFLDL